MIYIKITYEIIYNKFKKNYYRKIFSGDIILIKY